MTSTLGTKHIPTIVGVLILLGGLIGGILLTNSATTGFLPRASPETTPKSVKVTNISDTSFSVSWTTDSKVSGYLKYGTTNSLSLTSVDDRDQATGSTGAYRTHHVTLRGLDPSTTYYYKIGSSTNFLYDDSGKPYQTTTSTPVSSGAKTIYGQVLTTSQGDAGGILVYLNADDIAPLSTLTQNTGSFVISLSQARNKALTQAGALSDNLPIEILLQGQDGTSSLIKTVLNQAQPLPEITLGTNKDFTSATSGQLPPATPNISPKEIQSKFTAQLLAPPAEIVINSPSLTVASPAEWAVLTQSKPIFSGKFVKNTRVALQLSGPVSLQTTTTANSAGSWSVAPTKPLITGDYLLSVTATSSGSTETKSIPFVIALPSPSPVPVAQSGDQNPVLPTAGASELSVLILLSGALFIASGLFIWRAQNRTHELPY